MDNCSAMNNLSLEEQAIESLYAELRRREDAETILKSNNGFQVAVHAHHLGVPSAVTPVVEFVVFPPSSTIEYLRGNFEIISEIAYDVKTASLTFVVNHTFKCSHTKRYQVTTHVIPSKSAFVEVRLPEISNDAALSLKIQTLDYCYSATVKHLH